jgi:hypothetical protein
MGFASAISPIRAIDRRWAVGASPCSGCKRGLGCPVSHHAIEDALVPALSVNAQERDGLMTSGKRKNSVEASPTHRRAKCLAWLLVDTESRVIPFSCNVKQAKDHATRRMRVHLPSQMPGTFVPRSTAAIRTRLRMLCTQARRAVARGWTFTKRRTRRSPCGHPRRQRNLCNLQGASLRAAGLAQRSPLIRFGVKFRQVMKQRGAAGKNVKETWLLYSSHNPQVSGGSSKRECTHGSKAHSSPDTSKRSWSASCFQSADRSSASPMCIVA